MGHLSANEHDLCDDPECGWCKRSDSDDAPRPDKASQGSTVSGGERPEQVEDAPPREIFLQVEDGYPLQHASWCEEQINDADVRYVLAAIADVPPGKDMDLPTLPRSTSLTYGGPMLEPTGEMEKLIAQWESDVRKIERSTTYSVAAASRASVRARAISKCISELRAGLAAAQPDTVTSKES